MVKLRINITIIVVVIIISNFFIKKLLLPSKKNHNFLKKIEKYKNLDTDTLQWVCPA
jgi:uncharacterized protein YxeA